MVDLKIPWVSWALILPFTAAIIGYASPGMAQQAGQQFESAEAYARPTDQDKLREIGNTVNARRSEAFARKDAAAIAAVYAADATYIEILPALKVMSGRAQIETHLRDVLNAGTTQLQSTVTNAQMLDRDTEMLVAGDYYLVVKGKTIAGHFVQVLRREAGAWKIVSHIFARPDPVTHHEMSQANESHG